jgi:hypothetical protein
MSAGREGVRHAMATSRPYRVVSRAHRKVSPATTELER